MYIRASQLPRRDFLKGIAVASIGVTFSVSATLFPHILTSMAIMAARTGGMTPLLTLGREYYSGLDATEMIELNNRLSDGLRTFTGYPFDNETARLIEFEYKLMVVSDFQHDRVVELRNWHLAKSECEFCCGCFLLS